MYIFFKRIMSVRIKVVYYIVNATGNRGNKIKHENQYIRYRG